MIVPFEALLSRRVDRGAVGAFTCYDLETANGVLQAASGRKSGVVLLVSASTFANGAGGDAFLSALRAVAERHPKTAACIQLDHVSDLDLVAGAFELGAGAVMVDGSCLEFDRNVELVQAAAEIARRAGGAVEAELGVIEGNEDSAAAARAGQLTDPEQARSFVERSLCTCLAVSIGNVHGRYSASPDLDWGRLDRIARASMVPLALHGASGLSDADLRRAIDTGIVKVNLNTTLRDAYLAATAGAIENALPSAAVVMLHRAQTEAVSRVVVEKLDLFEPR